MKLRAAVVIANTSVFGKYQWLSCLFIESVLFGWFFFLGGYQ